MSALLEVNNIVAGYGPIEILHGVTLRAEAGEITCIIGPNGAGKSTLLKTVFGFVKPKSGNVTFKGEDITSIKPSTSLLRGLAYVPQGRSTFPEMSVEENLLMGFHVTNPGRRTVHSRIALVFEKYPILFKLRKHNAGSLSGGQQRTLEFARTVLLQPQLILLDEPSIGLSPKLTDEVYENIIFLNEQGVSILLVEQNVNKALEISHKGYVLDLGQNKFYGTAKDLVNKPELVKLYLGAGFE